MNKQKLYSNVMYSTRVYLPGTLSSTVASAKRTVKSKNNIREIIYDCVSLIAC